MIQQITKRMGIVYKVITYTYFSCLILSIIVISLSFTGNYIDQSYELQVKTISSSDFFVVIGFTPLLLAFIVWIVSFFIYFVCLYNSIDHIKHKKILLILFVISLLIPIFRYIYPFLFITSILKIYKKNANHLKKISIYLLLFLYYAAAILYQQKSIKKLLQTILNNEILHLWSIILISISFWTLIIAILFNLLIPENIEDKNLTMAST